MYDGKVENVTMRFFNGRIGTVLDRFGRDVTLIKDGDTHFKITVPVAISPQFYAWVFGLKNYVTIESPQHFCQRKPLDAQNLYTYNESRRMQ